jgi:hypothetical protein
MHELAKFHGITKAVIFWNEKDLYSFILVTVTEFPV